MFTFSRLSLALHFLLASFLILLVGMVIIGSWLGHMIEQGVLQRTAALSALYVDSFIGHHLPPLARIAQFDESDKAELDELFLDSSFSKQVVNFKLWGPDGQLVYSTDPAPDGHQFPVQGNLAAAFKGQVESSIVTADESNREEVETQYPRLIETYAPVRAKGSDTVLAVAEFYQKPDGLDREVQSAQQQSWLIVGLATLAMYLLLAGFVGQASAVISRQHRERRDRVQQLSALLEQNAQLNERVHRAAARTTALNERYLRRLASDLHDGPCQDLGLALLRIEDLADDCTPGNGDAAPRPVDPASQDYQTIQTALRSALEELRTISTGLWLPALDPLSPSEVAERAVRDYEVKSGANVALTMGDLPEEAPLPVKIALYRLLQEALTNGFRHASATSQRIHLWVDEGHLCARVTDSGKGFDPGAVSRSGHLGLVGMRERVELLGGAFELQSRVGRGTTVEARLPLTLPEDGNG